MKLQGKVAIVTGAGREGKGIGRYVALALASEGADIVIADYVVEAAEAVADEVRKAGRRAIAVRADVALPADCDAIVQRALDELGGVDVLVNNAGITRDALIPRMSEQEWDSVIATNLKGTFNCTKAVTRTMLKQRSGKIVNVASVMGIIGNPGQANYSASKGGVIALTKTAARELGSRGINVNAVAPGFIQTAMTDDLPESIRESISGQIPLNRLGTSEDVARLIVFLCTEDSSYITGQVVNVDGGMVM
ncbi:MAG: 3-oxoacyl-[acyl-carrier-protein] reductase [Armatimonadetes bacterium]|nr:3-oxoacyl-[acyl-carrier-protein] reductase [Armatimonadota bacterium]